MTPHPPYLRGAPPGLQFQFDAKTLTRGMYFTFITALGDLDLLGEITGGGNYEDLLPYTSELKAYGFKCQGLTIRKLIEVKRAAGRPKDLEAVAELELIEEERGSE